MNSLNKHDMKAFNHKRRVLAVSVVILVVVTLSLGVSTYARAESSDPNWFYSDGAQYTYYKDGEAYANFGATTRYIYSQFSASDDHDDDPPFYIGVGSHGSDTYLCYPLRLKLAVTAKDPDGAIMDYDQFRLHEDAVKVSPTENENVPISDTLVKIYNWLGNWLPYGIGRFFQFSEPGPASGHDHNSTSYWAFYDWFNGMEVPLPTYDERGLEFNFDLQCTAMHGTYSLNVYYEVELWQFVGDPTGYYYNAFIVDTLSYSETIYYNYWTVTGDPSIVITSPSNNQQIFSDTQYPSIRVWASTSDPLAVPVSQVTMQCDGGSWQTATYDPASGKYYSDFSVLAGSTNPLTHTFLAAETNTAGKTVYSDPVNVQVCWPWAAKTAPSGHNYHFGQISPTGIPYDTGYRIDTAGYAGMSEGGFDFFGYTTSIFQVGPDGAIHVQGYFRQDDTFYPDLTPTRRMASLYVMYASDLNTIIRRVDILDYTDGTEWKYTNVVIGGFIPSSAIVIGVGRPDRWAADWALAVEWAGTQVSTTTFGWTGQTSPAGHSMKSYPIALYGLIPGWHVDTIGYNDGGYNMYAYASQNFVVGPDGKIHVTGLFRQYDTLYSYLQAGRRLLRVYVLNPNTPSTIITNALVLQYTDGTEWVYKEVTISGLTPGSTVRIGFGREDNWASDWKVTAEWAGISIVS